MWTACAGCAVRADLLDLTASPHGCTLAVYADGIGKRQPAGFAVGEAGLTPAPSPTFKANGEAEVSYLTPTVRGRTLAVDEGTANMLR